MKRVNSSLLVGGILTLLLFSVALISLLWTPQPFARIDVAARLKGPLVQGLLGTDHFGRDVVSTLMVGAWNSLIVAWPAVLIGAVIGIALGCLAAAVGGLVENLVMRAADILFAFPAVLSAIVIGALMGSGPLAAVIAIALFNIPVFARVARGSALQIWALDYVTAARAIGKTPWRITWEEILPNMAGGLAVQLSLQLALAILTEAGLSYLGLGVRPPNPSWGRMLSDAQTYLSQAPHLALAPGCAIALAVLGLNLLGDGLRDAWDPRLR